MRRILVATASLFTVSWGLYESLSTYFMPHAHCLLQKPELVYSHLISNLIIAISYFWISSNVFSFKKDRRIQGVAATIFNLFAAFIMLCGLTHVATAINLYLGWYPLSISMDILTGVISLITAIVLSQKYKLLLSIPSPNTMLDLKASHEVSIKNLICPVIVTHADKIVSVNYAAKRILREDTPDALKGKKISGIIRDITSREGIEIPTVITNTFGETFRAVLVRIDFTQDERVYSQYSFLKVD